MDVHARAEAFLKATPRPAPAGDIAPCALCGATADRAGLAEARWLDGEAVARVAAEHPGWVREDGACPACVQETLLDLLLDRGDAALHDAVQARWPLDPEAAFGALPTPLRLHADPRFTGRGVTVALVDAAFAPHPDLLRPRNRIVAWVDASRPTVVARRFGPDEVPAWPGGDVQGGGQWHGVMTSVVAAGNGHASHGLYRSPASEPSVVLVQVADERGAIGNEAITRALRWLERNGPSLGVRVVSLSLGGDAVAPSGSNPVDRAVAALDDLGIVVVAAAGNDGVRRLVPPATAPHALTVGGLDDGLDFHDAARALWHGNHGAGSDGAAKPELVAPSLWVVAPVLPHSAVSLEAQSLFRRRAAGAGNGVEARIAALKLVTPSYQHVEGTSFAAPVVAATVACLLEADPSLTPLEVRRTLIATAQPVAGAERERQGAGALDAGRALATALDQRGARAAFGAKTSPEVVAREPQGRRR